MTTLTTENFKMEYYHFGQGKKALVIIPGLSVQSVMNSALAVKQAYKIFNEEYTVYLFDRRKNLPEKYLIHDMAEDTFEAITELGIEMFYLFGVSQGGMIALDMAVNHPERIKKLAVGSTVSEYNENKFQVVDEWIETAKSGDSQKLYQSFAKAIYPSELYNKSKNLLNELAKTVTEDEMKRFVVLAEGVKGYNLTNNLKEIVCPTLVIGSEDDGVFGCDGSKMIYDNLISRQGNELYIYNGYGHAAYDTAPDYKERIFSFFQNDDD